MNQWDEAARKAADEVIDREDEGAIDTPFSAVIAKHFADLRATYELLCQLAMATKAHIQAGGNEGIFVVEELLNHPRIVAAIVVAAR